MTDRKEMKKNRENNHGRKMIFAVSAALLTALVAFTACGTPGAANPTGTGTQTQNIVSGGQNAGKYSVSRNERRGRGIHRSRKGERNRDGPGGDHRDGIF